uniref:Uncharacterized protein n=1 Tax=Rhizophora mucronata TaxID=61149 RepID=A0A2P2NCB6_RHIMU
MVRRIQKKQSSYYKHPQADTEFESQTAGTSFNLVHFFFLDPKQDRIKVLYFLGRIRLRLYLARILFVCG